MDISEKLNKKLEKELAKKNLKIEKQLAKDNKRAEKIKAKIDAKNEKATPEYWINEGEKYYYTKPKKAIDCFKKASECGGYKVYLKIARLYKSEGEYTKAREYYKLAINVKIEDAESEYKKFEEEFRDLRKQGNIVLKEADKYHVTYKHDRPLFAPIDGIKDKQLKFMGEHVFCSCPVCRAGTTSINQESSGVEYTLSGKIIIDTFECDDPECGFIFKRYMTLKAEYRKKEPTFKDMVLGRDSKEEERVEVITIEHYANKNTTGKDVLSILKMGNGEFVRK